MSRFCHDLRRLSCQMATIYAILLNSQYSSTLHTKILLQYHSVHHVSLYEMTHGIENPCLPRNIARETSVAIESYFDSSMGQMSVWGKSLLSAEGRFTFRWLESIDGRTIAGLCSWYTWLALSCVGACGWYVHTSVFLALFCSGVLHRLQGAQWLPSAGSFGGLIRRWCGCDIVVVLLGIALFGVDFNSLVGSLCEGWVNIFGRFFLAWYELCPCVTCGVPWLSVPRGWGWDWFCMQWGMAICRFGLVYGWRVNWLLVIIRLCICVISIQFLRFRCGRGLGSFLAVFLVCLVVWCFFHGGLF